MRAAMRKFKATGGRQYRLYMLNEAFHYRANELHCEAQPLSAIAAAVGTPAYVYSLARVRSQLARLRAAFSPTPVRIHYSAKANGNLDILREVIRSGAGIDAVSGGEIWRARRAGCAAVDIVFAGVGKTGAEIDYAVREGVGWINIENAAECELIQAAAQRCGRRQRVGLRLNPDEAAPTQAAIATGHAAAKFGLSAATIREILARAAQYPALDFAALHVHIGSQLRETAASSRAIASARALLREFPQLRALNIGGGFPARYQESDALPSLESFVAELRPALRDLPTAEPLMLEPGRAIVADAGVLLTRVLYIKRQRAQTTAIVDASMSELLRPALYGARHAIVPLRESGERPQTLQIVGPVCETADTLVRDARLPLPAAGDVLAILTAGAYGMAMASNYNARPRPAEVVVGTGKAVGEGEAAGWRLSRAREDWQALYPGETQRPPAEGSLAMAMAGLEPATSKL